MILHWNVTLRLTVNEDNAQGDEPELFYEALSQAAEEFQGGTAAVQVSVGELTRVVYRRLWRQAKNGDVIICPKDGLPEKLIGDPQKRPHGKVFVRTSRHDHIRDALDKVEVIP